MLLLALALCAAPPEEPKELPITPVQGDVSVNFGFADRNPLAGAIYLGGALGWTSGSYAAFFGGAGLELTHTAFSDPYRISMGLQLRAGLVWARPGNRATSAIPDLLVFARLTPFGAGIATQTPGPMGATTVSRNYFGVRAGLGLTGLWPAREAFDRFPFFDVEGFWGELLKVLSVVLVFPLLIVNHAEVAFEWVMSPAPLTALVFRVGAGF
jgi:hypothetical protein